MESKFGKDPSVSQARLIALSLLFQMSVAKSGHPYTLSADVTPSSSSGLSSNLSPVLEQIFWDFHDLGIVYVESNADATVTPSVQRKRSRSAVNLTIYPTSLAIALVNSDFSHVTSLLPFLQSEFIRKIIFRDFSSFLISSLVFRRPIFGWMISARTPKMTHPKRVTP